jgi:hypothetical protein
MLTMGELQGFWSYQRTQIEYISWEHTYQTVQANSVTINAPSDNQENDLLFAYLLYECSSPPTTTPSSSGWTYVQRNYDGLLAAAILYKWCAASEAANYTFSHGDTPYGSMGGAILRFRNSIQKGHNPIRRVSPISGSPIYSSDSYTGNEDFGWSTDPLNVDVPGAIVLSLGAIRRKPTGISYLTMSPESVTGYTDLTGTLYIGGAYGGNNVGGGIGYQKFAERGVALDGGGGDPPSIATGGGGIAGEVGSSSGFSNLFGQLVMLI